MILKKLYTFYRLSTRRKLLFGLGLVLALYSWLIFRFLNKNARFGKKTEGEKTFQYSFSLPRYSALILDIRWTIFMVNKYIFWENVCRHQAYQAKLFCVFFNIPYQIFVGFKKNEEGKVEGHAWTLVNEEIITGFCKPEEYIVQAIYS